MKIKFKRDELLGCYAMRQAAFHFRLNLDGLKRWVCQINLFPPADKTMLLDSIAVIKMYQKNRKNPQPVSYDLGWSPVWAEKLLMDIGLSIDDYCRMYGDQWHGNSSLLRIYNNMDLSDSIVFYLRGDAEAVKQLTLELSVNNEKHGRTSDLRFSAVCAILLGRVMGDDAVDISGLTLKDGRSDEIVSGRRIRFYKEGYANSRVGGYSRVLTVDHAPDYKVLSESH